MSDLATRLGLTGTVRAAIISCDELGFCQAANTAIYESLRNGGASSASLMVPAPWSRDAAASYRGEDIGIHLTLNSELDVYRYGPITHAPSLVDGEGGFPRTIGDVWEHADLDEVRREWRAQIERAVLWGFRVSHLNAHLGGVELKPEFFDVYLDLAEEYRLAARLPAADEERLVGFPFRSLAAERDIAAPDRVLSARGSDLRTLFGELGSGVSEIHFHPAKDSEELRAADPSWQSRVEEYAAVGPGSGLRALANEFGVELIGYRSLQALMM